MSNKYYVGTVFERNGERTYTHKVRFETELSPVAYLEAIASTFLGESSEAGNGGYYFDCGCFFIKAESVQEVDEDFYSSLRNIVDVVCPLQSCY